MADGNQELITTEGATSLPVERPEYDMEGLSFSQRVALDPTIDIDRLRAVIEMENASQDRAAEKEFEKAFAEMQPNLPAIGRHGEGHQSATYAKLEDIQAAVREPLQKHGFSIRFKITDHEKDMSVTCVLSHVGGHSDSDTIRLPYETSGSKNNVQARGSTTAYGKRYTLANILGIQTGGLDNDGDDKSGNPLTAGQVTTLREKLATLGRTEMLFLEWAGKQGLGATELEAIPVENFPKLDQQLDHWIKMKPKSEPAND